MKRIFKYLCIAAAAAMMMFPAVASGQDAIYELPGIYNPNKSIVREYQNNIAVVYSFDGTDGYFYYVDMSTMNCRYAAIPGLNVSDFEIYKDRVYFCGSGIPGNIVGFFDINATFFSGAPAQFAVMPSSIYCYIDDPIANYEDIVSLKKIEVMDNPGWEPHMYLIGEATCTHSGSRINRCIIDVYYDGSTWNIAMTQDHESIFYVDDIAVTDNYVVAAGHKHPQDGEYIVGFPKPANPYDNIFDPLVSPLTPLVIMNWPVYAHGGVWSYVLPYDEDFLIEHISGDLFATVAHGGYPGPQGTVWGTVLNLYNTVANVVLRYHVTEASREYKDLRFNKETNSLYLLPGTVGSTLPDGYIEYVFDPSFRTLNHVNKHWNNSGKYESSLDAAPLTMSAGLGQSIVTGVISSKLFLWRHLPNTGCSSSEEIIPFRMDIYGGSFKMDFHYIKHSISFVQYYPSVEETREINPYCEGNKTND